MGRGDPGRRDRTTAPAASTAPAATAATADHGARRTAPPTPPHRRPAAVTTPADEHHAVTTLDRTWSLPMNRPDQPRRPAPRRTPAAAAVGGSPPTAPRRRTLANPATTRRAGRDRSRPAGGAARPQPVRRVRRPAGRRPLRLASPGTRLRVGLFAVAFLLSLFAGRLLQLQGVEASAYATVADTERRITETLSATRGTITDRSGIPLATTVDSVNVFADQTQVENPALTARMLAPFVDVNVTTLERGLIGDRQFAYLAKDVDMERWTEIAKLDLPGIHAETTHRRTYPGGELAANVVGFVDAAGVGQAGVEQALRRRAHRRRRQRVRPPRRQRPPHPERCDDERAAGAGPGRPARRSTATCSGWPSSPWPPR